MFILLDKEGTVICTCTDQETVSDFARICNGVVQRVQHFDGYTKPTRVTLFNAVAEKDNNWRIVTTKRTVWNFEITSGSSVTKSSIHIWGFYEEAVLGEIKQRLEMKKQHNDY